MDSSSETNDTCEETGEGNNRSNIPKIGLTLSPLASFVCLVAVFAGSSGAAVIFQQYLIPVVIAILAYLIVILMLAVLNEDEMRRYFGALIATGTLLPVTLVMTTVITLGLGWAVPARCQSGGTFTLFWGSVIAVWGWFVAAFICSRCADFASAVPSSAGEFGRRLCQVKSAHHILCSEVLSDPSKCGNAKTATVCMEIQCQVDEIDKTIKKSGPPWVLGTGYMNVWGRLYSAEEALIEVLPQEKVVEGAIRDELRLEGSDMDPKQRDELLEKLRNAVCVIDSGARQFLKKTVMVAPTLAISTPSQLPVQQINTDFSQLLQATGGTPPYMWEVISDSKVVELKAAGLQLDNRTGVLNGNTPKPHDFVFQVRVTDSNDLSVTKCFSLAVKDKVTATASPPSNSPLNAEARSVLRSVRASINEYREARWNGLILARNRLMATLFFTSLTVYVLLILALVENASRGSVIAASVFYMVGAAIGLGSRLGSESENKTGFYDYGLSAAGLVTVPVFSGLTALGGVVLIAMLPYAGQILGPLQSEPLAIVTPQQLRDATVAERYLQPLEARGGTKPYTWAMSANALNGMPDGLGLESSGALSGTPTNSGSARFALRVTDSSGATAENVFALTIKPLPEKLSRLAVDTTSPLPAATAGESYSKRLQALGGKPAYTWSVVGDSLQGSGLELDKNTGELKGAPRKGQIFTFTVEVKDAVGKSERKTLSLPVRQPEQASGSGVPTTGGTAGSIPTLKEVFNLSKNLGGILIAAIFGLTPSLLFDRLKQMTDKYKQDLKSSQTTQGK
ncbi:Ig domain-containing protein [Geobacter sp.]|uniref:Ig domain-containing protein n=1 Tax=Geobacter sp. TaxID=46610 RepID=UPI0027BAD951|nr:Ig domain-containing protein [Geobacter sp.]